MVSPVLAKLSAAQQYEGKKAKQSAAQEKWADEFDPPPPPPPPPGKQPSSGTFTVEIVLDPEVLRALCVRGRRRFRDIKAAGQAELKLDILRGVMQVSGTKNSIADVRRRLATVSGPCMNVTAAVWAELMRTRMNPDPSEAAVPTLQQASGCRIHIERDAKQVRLFGPKDQVAIAQRLLCELEIICIEQAVEIQAPQYLDLEMLEAFATEFGVTLHVEETKIIVLGIDGAVKAAAQELLEYDSDRLPSGLDSSAQGSKPSELARSAIAQAMSKLKAEADCTKVSSPHSTYSTCDSLPAFAEGESFSTDGESFSNAATAEKQMQGVVMYKQQEQETHAAQLCDPVGACSGVCSACSDCRGYFAQRGTHATQYSSNCQTCASANFCTFCGAATPTMQSNNTMSYAAQASQQAYQPGMTYVDQGYMMPMPMPMQNGQSMMMPMQVCQTAAADGTMVMMAPNGMMPMQSMQQFPRMAGAGGMQAVADGTMVMMAPNGMMPMQSMQQFPMMAGPCGMQAQPTMMNNGLQQCMVQMPMQYATG